MKYLGRNINLLGSFESKNEREADGGGRRERE